MQYVRPSVTSPLGFIGLSCTIRIESTELARFFVALFRKKYLQSSRRWLTNVNFIHSLKYLHRALAKTSNFFSRTWRVESSWGMEQWWSVSYLWYQVAAVCPWRWWLAAYVNVQMSWFVMWHSQILYKTFYTPIRSPLWWDLRLLLIATIWWSTHDVAI